MSEEPICNVCGEKATMKDVNPYLKEISININPEQFEEEWWCDECYQNSLWDI